MNTTAIWTLTVTGFWTSICESQGWHGVCLAYSCEPLYGYCPHCCSVNGENLERGKYLRPGVNGGKRGQKPQHCPLSREKVSRSPSFEHQLGLTFLGEDLLGWTPEIGTGTGTGTGYCQVTYWLLWSAQSLGFSSVAPCHAPTLLKQSQEGRQNLWIIFAIPDLVTLLSE